MNNNHPKKGSHVLVEPIKDRTAIKRIKTLLCQNPRDFCLFVFGINTAYRANELLSVQVGQVRYLDIGESLNIKMSKTGKYRRVTLNKNVIEAIQTLLNSEDFCDQDPLFRSQRGGKAIGVDTLSTYVKHWCQNAGLRGNYASHTLRKTWGYWQRIANKTPIPILMDAFGHASQTQTLSYLGIQEQEIQDVYLELTL